MNDTVWTKEKVAKLKELRAGGYTTKEITDALGPEFTRNMVIGKAKRMGFKTPNLPPTLKRDKPNLGKIFFKKKFKPAPPPPPKPAKWVEPEGVPFSVVVTKNVCQYGLKNGLYCGCPIHPNQYKRPYCANHLSIIYDQSGTRRMGDYQKRVLHELSYREKSKAGTRHDEITQYVPSEFNV